MSKVLANKISKENRVKLISSISWWISDSHRKHVSGGWDLQRTKKRYWSDKRQSQILTFREPVKTELKSGEYQFRNRETDLGLVIPIIFKKLQYIDIIWYINRLNRIKRLIKIVV